jgi:hypothetical protein
MQFISPNSVTVTNGVGSYPASFNYVWADTTSPTAAVDSQVNTVIHISNWQGTEQQFELLTGGYFVDYTNKTIYRIVAAKYHAPDGSGNAIDLYVNKPAVLGSTSFQVVPFNLVAGLFSVMVRLESGVATIRNANDSTTSSLAAVNQRITISPASNIRGYVEAILIDTTATGVAEASNSK